MIVYFAGQVLHVLAMAGFGDAIRAIGEAFEHELRVYKYKHKAS